MPLRHILDAIGRIESHAAPGRALFDAEPMRQDAILRTLEVIGEAVSRLDPDVRAGAADFSWRTRSGCATG